MLCAHGIENCGTCDPGLPTPRIIRLSVGGVVQHFYTWSDAPLGELTLGDLKPYPALAAWAWLEGLHRPRPEIEGALNGQ